MGKNRKTSNDVELLKGISSDIPADLHFYVPALFATIAALRKTVEAQNRIIKSNYSANLPLEFQALVTTIAALTKANESDNRVKESQDRANQELTKQNAELLKKIEELTVQVISLVEKDKRNTSAKSNDSSNSGIPLSASNPA